jgi:dTDP-4-dehydrorhamnose reductase
MRLLVLGVSGLIGHKLYEELSSVFNVYGTLHKSKKDYGNIRMFDTVKIIDNINILDFEILKGVLAAIKPDVIVNCVGVTKRKITSENFLDVVKINSVFPHQLADWAKENKKRVIHFSTDCVFDGEVGNYSENSLTTAKDIYGRTKALGELNYKHTLTIRSSFIGKELLDKTELLEWFLAQKGKKIKGYTKTLYSGVTTIFMSSVIKKVIQNYPTLSGLYQLAPDKPISKHDLLTIANMAFNAGVDITPEENHIHLPTLDGTALKQKIDLKVPSWKEMMFELAKKS